MNHVEQAKAIYLSLKAMRPIDMDEQQFAVFIALEEVFEDEGTGEQRRAA